MVFSSIAHCYFDEFPFRPKDHRKSSCNYFFLSHAHSDHINGIKYVLSDPDAIIVCSRETAIAINVLHRIPREKCLILKASQSLSFDNYVVHALDANHCLGSLMFVIESVDGEKQVYTGDFRLGTPILEELDIIQGANQLWVDFTYGRNSLYQFKSREELISEIITLILREGNYPERDIWIAGYQIGKEILLKTISNALKTKIWAPEQKVKIYKKIGGEWDIFTNEMDSGVFVASRRIVEDSLGIANYDHKKMSEAVRISPTGWAIRLRKKRLDVHFFPYSDHCSYSEVHKFIEIAQAQRIIKL